MFRRWVLLVIFLALMMTPVYAQDSTTAGAQDNLSMSEEGNVSLDFRDADIQNVLRILSYKSGVNIVAGPEVTGLITIKLQEVPWQKALQVVLETYGYAYEQRGNIITVTTIDNLKKRREDAKLLSDQEPLITKTYVLSYAKATDVMGSIDKMKTGRGSINMDERTNAVIVRDIPENLELISTVIEQLDQTTPQVLIEAKIVETTLSNTDKLGIDWIAQASITGSARPHMWPFTSSTANKYAAEDDFPAADDSDFSFGTLSFAEAQAVFEMLSTRTDTNILSNPRIVTLDNKLAKIIVGSQYPIPQYDYNEEQAQLQVSGWEYKDIGIIFEVTPHVNNTGYVTLDINPKITAILDYVTVENTSLPQLSNEEAMTSVMIKDGETLVIAGLIKDQTSDVKRKLPILGDIPILGLLFQKKEKTSVKTDLLIFLTPHIITQEQP
ncbi:MAG: type IV pilus secretin PilQ [Candidatus Omnitrophota bacterium]|jgi:type IV pilus assembly protein PilQ